MKEMGTRINIKRCIAAVVVYAGVMLLPISGSAEEAGDFIYSILEDGTVSITGYNGADIQVVIPDRIDDKTISTIGEGAFFSQTRIEEIVLPSRILSRRSRTVRLLTVLVLRLSICPIRLNISENISSDGTALLRR